jgi:predicted membrane metal-binding protein
MIGWVLVSALFFSMSAWRIFGPRSRDPLDRRGSNYIAIAYACLGVSLITIAFGRLTMLGGLLIIVAGVLGAAVSARSIQRMIERSQRNRQH